jgi:hypothetical protein
MILLSEDLRQEDEYAPCRIRATNQTEDKARKGGTEKTTAMRKIAPQLILGIVIPIVFLATTLICGFIQGDYNHLTRMVSELGALGTESQVVFSAGLLICAGLSLPFILGLCRACRTIGISLVPVLILLSFTVSISGVALFPLPLRLHLIMGLPSILLILSPLSSLWFWTKPDLLRIRTAAVISFVVMSLGFLVYFPNVLGGVHGLKQRVFHLGWAIWFIFLSRRFSKRTATSA